MGQGRSLKLQREDPPQAVAGTADGRAGGQAGGHYMMEQADSGFRTWQVQAAPQYCRKVW